MEKNLLRVLAMLVAVASTGFFSGCANMGMSDTPRARSESGLSAEARAALNKLKADVPPAASLSANAKGILVFPSVTKGGLIVGGLIGQGVLFKQGAVHGYYYYDTGGASYGLQAGLQNDGNALSFMSENALRHVDETQGWEIGVGPSVVIVDAGMGKTLTTTSAQKDVYAFIFDQKGLMAGVGLQGSRTVRIDK